MLNKLERKIKDGTKRLIERFGFTLVKLPEKMLSATKVVHTKIGKFDLAMKENHQLPVFLKYQQYYSKNLPRLTIPVLEKYPDLSMIDVGANIGDTVALVRSVAPPFPIICFEGDDIFFELLAQNMKQFRDVKIEKQLLSDKNESINVKLQKHIETARLAGSTSADATTLSLITLDSYFTSHHTNKKPKLLKVDTDGYDMKIIRGGEQYLRETKPVLFFEYDTVFLDDQKEDALGTFDLLEKMGYSDIVYYDNFGKLILSTTLKEKRILEQLHKYIDPKTRTPIPYYDVAVFHGEDADVAKKFIDSEMKFFYN